MMKNSGHAALNPTERTNPQKIELVAAVVLLKILPKRLPMLNCWLVNKTIRMFKAEKVRR